MSHRELEPINQIWNLDIYLWTLVYWRFSENYRSGFDCMCHGGYLPKRQPEHRPPFHPSNQLNSNSFWVPSFKRSLAWSIIRYWTMQYFCYFDLSGTDISLQIWIVAWFCSALNFLPLLLQFSKSLLTFENVAEHQIYSLRHHSLASIGMSR